MTTLFFSHRYAKTENNAARRWRTVMSLKDRLSRAWRQAVTWERAALRNMAFAYALAAQASTQSQIGLSENGPLLQR